MQKSIFSIIFLSTILSASSFNEFLTLALQANPELKTASLSIEQSNKKAEQSLRYENPSLELEVSNFSPNRGSNEFGSRIALSQPIRVWGVGDDKKAYSKTQTKLLKSHHTLNRSVFIYDISMNYLSYIHSAEELELTHESLTLAKNIFDISNAMYQGGKISKGEMLQAKMAFSTLNSQVAVKKYQQSKSYYELLKRSNLTQEIEVDMSHMFVLKEEKTINPELEVLQNSSLTAQSRATLHSNKIDSVELLAEYENEPDQDIFRIGVSLPLALFNTNAEAKSIALLEVKKQDSFIESKKKIVSFELKQLFEQLKELELIKRTHEELLKDELELLAMFEEGYKIANINLLSLQDIKNSLINTKENILNIKLSSQQNIIKINYLQGSLNE